MTNHYHKLIRQFSQTFSDLGSSLIPVGNLDSYPIFGGALGSPQAPFHLLLTAGLHGDEPGSPAGLLQWLQRAYPHWRDQLYLCVFPCLNPYGLEHCQREADGGVDLNRQFHQYDFRLAQGLHCLLQGQRFDLAIDLHEDIDTEKFYVWEIAPKPLWGPRVIQGILPLVPVYHLESPDGAPAVNGVISQTYASLSRKIKERLRGRPLSHFLTEHYTDHALTTELPGKLPLARRVAIENVLLNHVVQRGTAAYMRPRSRRASVMRSNDTM